MLERRARAARPGRATRLDQSLLDVTGLGGPMCRACCRIACRRSWYGPLVWVRSSGPGGSGSLWRALAPRAARGLALSLVNFLVMVMRYSLCVPSGDMVFLSLVLRSRSVVMFHGRMCSICVKRRCVAVGVCNCCSSSYDVFQSSKCVSDGYGRDCVFGSWEP